MSTPHTDKYDTPWKAAIETYFQDFIAFFLPQAHPEIAWEQPVVFRDKELQKLIVDKLAQVRLRSGAEAWVFIHIEVQSQGERGFAGRMFLYHVRLRDRYGRTVVSIAILGERMPLGEPTILPMVCGAATSASTFRW